MFGTKPQPQILSLGAVCEAARERLETRAPQFDDLALITLASLRGGLSAELSQRADVYRQIYSRLPEGAVDSTQGVARVLELAQLLGEERVKLWRLRRETFRGPYSVPSEAELREIDARANRIAARQRRNFSDPDAVACRAEAKQQIQQEAEDQVHAAVAGVESLQRQLDDALLMVAR